MFKELTQELLDLDAAEKGSHEGLYAVFVYLCCTCCCCIKR